jgi:hypothetical protein
MTFVIDRERNSGGYNINNKRIEADKRVNLVINIALI